ncbi:pyocin knob domain-containing protein [Lactococcus lactis]|uniref:Phage tail assembly n=2 Tax=Lactococcus lactis TaxID=1358 RepID=A0A0V8ED62_LACLL|nr:pyocin knob domain-containing protein [Lactococcus lactis]KSU23402.1 Phage tail assembly [Lactococcus lactis subsp. lactis]
MSYDKQTWNKYDELKTEEENIENGAVVTDNRMNHMETGIGDNDANLASHLADKNNPHKVTAAQVGLDKVDNVKQASKVEFDSHTSDISNPHKVTATQVGAYSKDESDQKLATQKQAIDSHVNNKSNPHAVTASQVGAYSKSETDTKFASAQSLTDLSNKAFVNKGNLASGTDLNNVTDTGYYRIGGLVGGTDILNSPSEVGGIRFYAFFTVTGSLQELTVYSPKQDTTWTYSRSISGSPATWSNWSKTVMADDSGKVTIKDLVVTATVKTVNLEITGQSTKTVSIYNGGGQIILTRIGPMVQADIRSMPAIPSNTTISGVIPDGYKPAADYTSITHSNNRLIFYANGSIKPDNNAMVSDNGYYSCSWVTKDATPTT